jgi:pre-60S factor REI1
MYNQRLLNHASSTQGKLKAESEAYKPRECIPCKKVFASMKSLENHLNSKKHCELASNFKDMNGDVSIMIKILEKLDIEKIPKQPSVFSLTETSDEKEIQNAIENHLGRTKPLNLSDCIFCSQCFSDFESAMNHMTKAHSMYIPDLLYVKDLEKLIGYLGEKVSIGFCCLYCPSTIQPFRSLASVRKHMIDSGHCKIRFDEIGFNELSEFYDYTESYPIIEDDGNVDYEDVDSDAEIDGPEQAIISADGAELVLPSGKTLGHRAYRHIFKQNLQFYDQEREPRSRQREIADKLMHQYHEAGVLAHLPTQKAVYDQKEYCDRRKEFDLRIGKKTSGLQKHFRLQWLQ